MLTGASLGHGQVREFFTVFLVVAAYWFSSIILVFINKRVLTLEEFEVPVFITWFQCVVTVICLYVAHHVFTSIMHWRSFPTFLTSFLVHIKTMNFTTIFIGMVLFNNFTLKLVPVCFYNVARALSTVFNMVFTRVILGESISQKASACCFVVIGGFILGIFEERSFTYSLRCVPIIMGILSSVFVSLFAIYTKLSLAYVSNNVWQLQVVNNINSVVMLLPLIPLLGDAATLLHIRGSVLMSSRLWASLVLTGTFGFLVGICTSLQVKHTSPLTHNISGTAKACVQTMLAMIFFNEGRRSFRWWFSNALVLLGSAAYSYVKGQEMLAQSRRVADLTFDRPSKSA